MHSPFEEHLEAVYRILGYLKGNPGKGLFFKKTSEKMCLSSPMPIGQVQSQIEDQPLDIVPMFGVIL